MPRIPFLSEKVTDTLLRALRFGGFLADDASVDAIRTVENSASESDLDNLVASLSYGNTAGTDLSSTEDINVFINSIANLGSNWFRVSHNQGSAPVTDPNNELLTLRSPGNVLQRDTDGPQLIVGPRTTLSPVLNYFAALRVGTASSGTHYFNVDAGPKVINSGTEPGAEISTATTTNLSLKAFDEIQVRNQTDALAGGWDAISTSNPALHVGQYDVNKSIALEKLASHNSRIRLTDTGNIRTIFMRSDNSVDNYTLRVAIGGKEGESWGDPGTTSQLDSTVLIVNSPILTPSSRKTLVLLARETAPPAETEIFTIRSDASALGAPNPPLYLMRVWKGPIGSDVPVFNIKEVSGTTDANCPGGFVTGAADVAEQVHVDGKASDYPFGTVLCVGPDGVMKSSDMEADPKVIGVVVDKPGLKLGDKGIYDDSTASRLVTPLKNYGKDIAKLEFDGDVTEEFSGVGLLKIHWTYIAVKSAVFDSETETTSVEFVDPRMAMTIIPEMRILKEPKLREDVVNMTICGIIPVRCVTKNGSIEPGDILVSFSDGQAVKSTAAEAGTVIGKALRALSDDGSGNVTGLVTAMVNLQ